jgi:hypothetical protein
VSETIDPVFTKTSPKRSFCMTENERFGLVFTKTGSINSDTGLLKRLTNTGSVYSVFTFYLFLYSRDRPSERACQDNFIFFLDGCVTELAVDGVPVILTKDDETNLGK